MLFVSSLHYPTSFDSSTNSIRNGQITATTVLPNLPAVRMGKRIANFQDDVQGDVQPARLR